MAGRNRKRKKLKQESIIKNSSNQVSHSIQKIKENERKYTIILVSLFFFIFCLIGYFTLRVHDDFDTNYIISENANKHGVTTSGRMITLTEQSVLSDSLGLKSDEYPFIIENYNDETIHYRLLLLNDEFTAHDCGCDERLFPLSSIHYSIDSNIVQTTKTSNILYEGDIAAKDSKEFSIKLWIGEDSSYPIDSHFHGRFDIETS